MHTIFYVNDIDIPANGRFRKNETGHDVAMQLSDGLYGSETFKFTEYSGREFGEETVGVIFPAHAWGLTLAESSFLASLKLSPKTYVYIVVMGDKIGGEAKHNMKRAFCEDVSMIFNKKDVKNFDVFVKDTAAVRDHIFTEEKLRGERNPKNRIKSILAGLMFYSTRELAKRSTHVNESFHKKLREESPADIHHVQVGGIDLMTFSDKKKEEPKRMASGRRAVGGGNIFADDRFVDGIGIGHVG